VFKQHLDKTAAFARSSAAEDQDELRAAGGEEARARGQALIVAARLGEVDDVALLLKHH